MNDQVIDAAMACGLTADACRDHVLVGWIVMWDPPAYPDKFIARLATSTPAPYVLIANSLAELQAQLPAGLVRYERTPSDPPDMVEIWCADAGSLPKRDQLAHQSSTKTDQSHS